MKLTRSLSFLAISAVILLGAACVAGEGGGAPGSDGLSVADENTAADGLPVAGNGTASIPLAEPTLLAKGPLPGQAVLVRGSESVRGVAGFGRNAIPALFGEYAYTATGGSLYALSVWYTREALVLDDEWSPLSCSGMPAGFTLAQINPTVDGSQVVVVSTDDFRIVLHLPDGFGSPCRFASVLIERFVFFIRNASREEDISFPAFLQL